MGDRITLAVVHCWIDSGMSADLKHKMRRMTRFVYAISCVVLYQPSLDVLPHLYLTFLVLTMVRLPLVHA